MIVPSYYEAGDPDFIRAKDEAAKKIFQEVFKNREVTMSNALELNYSGGGFHCITLNKPKIRQKSFWRRKFG